MTITTLQHELAEYQTAISNRDGAIANLRAELAQSGKDRIIDELRVELNNAQNRNSQLNLAISELQSDVEQMSSNIFRLHTKSNDFELELSQKDEEYKMLEKALQLKGELGATNADAEIEKTIKTLRGQVDELKHEKSEFENSVSEKDRLISELQKSLIEKHNSVSKMRTEITDLDSIISKLKKTVAEDQTIIAASTEKVVELETEAVTLKETVTTFEGNYMLIYAQLNAVKSGHMRDMAKLSTSNSADLDELESLKRQLENAKKELLEAKRELEEKDSDSDFEIEINEISEERPVETTAEDVEIENVANSSLMDENQSLVKQIDQLNRIIADHSSETNDLLAEIRSLANNLRNMEAAVKELENDSRIKSEHIEVYLEQNTKSKSYIESLEKGRAELEDKIARQAKVIASREQTNSHLSNQLGLIVEDLQKEIDSKRQILEQLAEKDGDLITVKTSFKSQIDKLISKITKQETEIEIAKSFTNEIEEKLDQAAGTDGPSENIGIGKIFISEYFIWVSISSTFSVPRPLYFDLLLNLDLLLVEKHRSKYSFGRSKLLAEVKFYLINKKFFIFLFIIYKKNEKLFIYEVKLQRLQQRKEVKFGQKSRSKV